MTNITIYLSTFLSNLSLDPPDEASPTTSPLLRTAAIALVALGANYARDVYNQKKLRASQQQFDQAFQGFPKEEMWRLFIDWKRQAEGADAFDVKEPGYRKAMEEAFSHLRHSIGKKLDAEELIKIHDLCVQGVKNEQNDPFKKGLSPKGAEYRFYRHYTPHFHGDLVSSEEELEAALKEGVSKNLFTGYPQDPNSHLYLSHYDSWDMRSLAPAELGKLEEKIETLIKSYYQEIGAVKTKREKLGAIVDLCRALEIYHVFSDGNQRTIAFVLLNKLLIENKFSPAILKDPLIFDGYCTTEKMIAHVEEGMKRFADFQKGSEGI